MIINRLNEASDTPVINGAADIIENEVYTEYTEVSSYDTEYLVYLHSYEKDGLVYNFVSSANDSTFAFYYILQRNQSDDAG